MARRYRHHYGFSLNANKFTALTIFILFRQIITIDVTDRPTPNEYRDIIHDVRYARRRLLRCERKLLESTASFSHASRVVVVR